MGQPTRIEELSEGLQVVMRAMFDAVGAPHDMELVGDWYNRYSWDAEQEAAFKEWLMDFLQNHPARRDVVSRLCRTKKSRERFWGWFNLMYGWKRSN